MAAGQADLEHPGPSFARNLIWIKDIACPGAEHKMTTPGRGNSMASQLELSSRAALCRELAQREPESRVYWLAEAERWSRLSRQTMSVERTGHKDDPFEQLLALIARQSQV